MQVFYQHLNDMCHDMLESEDNTDSEEDEQNPSPPTEKKTRTKRIILARRTEDGELVAIPPTESCWYGQYIDCPQVNDSRFLSKFRARFRLPYDSFVEFVQEAKNEMWFPRWMGCDATGKPASPVELLILGSLRYLGRGCTFDDSEEHTAISEEVHRTFFHCFIEVGSTILFDKYVRTPVTVEEMRNHTHEFEMAGMPGTLGSSDATHILHEKCSYRLRRLHLGGKSKHPTRTYNITVNHRRRILGTTCGHPGSWNDKSLVLFDSFMIGIKRGEIFDDNIFELLEIVDGKVVSVKYRGAWIVVDNGYHSWSTTVPPFTKSCVRTEIRWSEWVESMRKDVECTFGILKGRWRILKTGIRMKEVGDVDKIWKTCCALHNMLLEIDGLDKAWTGITTDNAYDGAFGEIDINDVPNALRRIHNPANNRNYDMSSAAEGNVVSNVNNNDGETESMDDWTNEDDDESSEDEDDDETSKDDNVDEDGIGDDEDLMNEDIRTDDKGVRVVRLLSQKFFRERLVEHFDIMYQRDKIQWPKRRGAKPALFFDQ
jgi:hypothetical protein